MRSSTLHVPVTALILLAAAVTALQDMQCCAMTEAQLTAIIGESSSCPKAWSCEPYVFEKCAACSTGKCGWLQTNGRQYCLCPETFIAAHKENPQNQACVAGYGAVWPNSAGDSDARLQSCGAQGVDVVRDDSQNDGCAANAPSPSIVPGPEEPIEEAKGNSNLGVILGASITGAAAIVAAIIGARYARKGNENESKTESKDEEEVELPTGDALAKDSKSGF